MFAVFKTGGKQYRAKAGDTVKVEKLEGEAGAKVSFDDIIAAGGKVVGLDKAKVEAEILEQDKDKKVIVFKKKRRHNYRRKIGHRQLFTKLRILSVTDADGKTDKVEPAKKPAAKKAAAPAKAKKAASAKTAEKKTAAKKSTTKKPAAKKPAAKKEEK